MHSEDLLCEAAPLTRRLPEAHQEPTVGALLGLAYHDGDEDVMRAILEGLSRANPPQELIDERVARGEAPGAIRGKREALRAFLQARFGSLPECVSVRPVPRAQPAHRAERLRPAAGHSACPQHHSDVVGRASWHQAQEKAMTRTLTMHFSDEQAERLERFARDRNADLEQTGVRLIRLRACVRR